MTKINRIQLNKGIKIELEHTKSRKKAKEIAEEHLEENSCYYKKASVTGKNKLVAVKRKIKNNKLLSNLTFL